MLKLRSSRPARRPEDALAPRHARVEPESSIIGGARAPWRPGMLAERGYYNTSNFASRPDKSFEKIVTYAKKRHVYFPFESDIVGELRGKKKV